MSSIFRLDLTREWGLKQSEVLTALISFTDGDLETWDAERAKFDKAPPNKNKKDRKEVEFEAADVSAMVEGDGSFNAI